MNQEIDAQNAKLESCRQGFKELDINNDGFVDKSEIKKFLESKGLKNQDEFLMLLFNSIDTNHDGTIDINEFVKNYTLQLVICDEKAKEKEALASECSSRINQLKVDEKKYANERMIGDVSEFSTLEIEIDKINSLRSNQYRNLKLKVTLNNESKQAVSKDRKGNFYFFNETLVLKPESKDSYLKLFLTDENDTILGNFDQIELEQLINQTTFSVELQVGSDVDPNIQLFDFSVNVTFNWNLKEKIKGLIEVEEAQLAAFIEECKFHKQKLTELDKPFNLFNFQIQNQKQSESYLWKTHPKEYEVAENMENKLKQSLGVQKIRWTFILKILLFSSLILSLLNMFTRADFINMMIPIYILAFLSTGFSQDQTKNINLFDTFLIAGTFTFVTDLLWIIFRSASNTADAGSEDFIRGMVFFTSIIAFFVKLVLVIVLWIQKLKVQKFDYSNN